MNNDQTSSSSHDTILESARKIRQKKQREKRAKTRKKITTFLNTDIQDSEFGIIPEGYGGVTYLLFFIFGPWITGEIFMFLYASNGSLDTFKSLDMNALLAWVIGYEVLALIILLVIFNKFIKFMFG